jgi:asparagine synthase (glutamine-hydrolysing)
MCGICGVAGGDPRREAPWVAAMCDRLAHRGPDDHGVVVDGPVVLGNRRLAIIDLSSAGHQPLGSETRGGWIAYNGEIYNHAELRRELEREGQRFAGASDTEVLLALYLRDGVECLARLRGMFAFAIWDRRRQVLFAARDHFGQKPFYYTERDGRLIFASEIKALLTHPDVSIEPEPAAIDYYLSLRLVPPPLTMFSGIRKLAPGHWLEWTPAGGVRTGSYWSPAFVPDESRSDDDWNAALRSALVDAVEAHTVSDVPFGAFLSGGLDSSVVVALLSRHGERRIPTFCIGSDSPAFDERPMARVMAEQCRTTHHERVVSPRLLARVPILVETLDEPSDPIAACFEAAAQLASEHVRVALGGDGGDEMFGGFDRYAAFAAADRYAALPRWLREDMIGPAIRLLRGADGYKTLTQRAQWLDDVSRERGGRLYARMSSHFRFGPERKRELYAEELASQLRGADALAAVARPFDQAPGTSALDRMLFADLVTRLPEHTLMLADRLSMARSLEVRSPLLDVRLADLCFAMPSRLRAERGKTKIALRRAARGWVPESLLGRAKQGFMFPVSEWLDAPTLRTVDTWISSGPLVSSGWIRADAVRALAGEHASGRADHHVRLWQLLSLDSWHRRYLGNVPADQQVEALERSLPVPNGPPLSASRPR